LLESDNGCGISGVMARWSIHCGLCVQEGLGGGDWRKQWKLPHFFALDINVMYVAFDYPDMYVIDAK
jgi:hypothetical protein